MERVTINISFDGKLQELADTIRQKLIILYVIMIIKKKQHTKILSLIRRYSSSLLRKYREVFICVIMFFKRYKAAVINSSKIQTDFGVVIRTKCCLSETSVGNAF